MSECDSGRRVTFWCHNHGSPWRVGQDGCDFARAEKAEAQVQRVRKVCDLWQRRTLPVVAITAVLRALDGDGDE